MTIERPDYPLIIKQLAKQANQSCGLSFELYSERFQSSVNALLERLPDDEKEKVIAIAEQYDYERNQPNAVPSSASDWGEDICYCSHGIDIDCCPAGCGE